MKPGLVVRGYVTIVRGGEEKVNFVLFAKKYEIEVDMAATAVKYQNLVLVVRCSSRGEFSFGPL